jgi:hypothetical protein
MDKVDTFCGCHVCRDNIAVELWQAALIKRSEELAEFLAGDNGAA